MQSRNDQSLNYFKKTSLKDGYDKTAGNIKEKQNDSDDKLITKKYVSLANRLL